LHELGHDTTIMVRSILLRGFDRQVSDQIGEYMERLGIRFLQPCVPTKLEKLKGKDGPITVTYHDEELKTTSTEEFDTVLFAIGREAQVKELGIDKAGVTVVRGKIKVDDFERTNVPNIYAIGDIILDRPELTPVAIQAGILLSRRITNVSKHKMDYMHIPTTVFTPIEYGCVGMSQEDAEAKLGQKNVEVFLSRFGSLEGATTNIDEPPRQASHRFTGKRLFHRQHMLSHKQAWDDYEEDSFEEEERGKKLLKQPLLAKLVCDKTKNNEVVGFHYLGPNAGEVTQGFALALKLKATKQNFDDLVGIHPTCAEEFTSLSVTLSSGEDFLKKGGC